MAEGKRLIDADALLEWLDGEMARCTPDGTAWAAYEHVRFHVYCVTEEVAT